MPDIKLKNYEGTDWPYEAVPKVWLESPESTEESRILVPFTYGEAVSKTVEPDFSGGDMAVPIPEGELVTELVIAKPEGLVPENIAKDVVVAGVKGTHSGGGGNIDFTEDILKYLAYSIDTDTNTIYLYQILYDILYELTGSYDITIPDNIAGYDVVIVCSRG